jgi:hypothetical protein
MNTKIVMTASSIALASAGILLTFMPDEILKYFNLDATSPLLLLLQILGALYFAFALLNWMSRNGPIGGIYNKPIATANFAHFLIGGLALVKGILSNPDLPNVFLVIAAIYTIFTIAFSLINFRNPSGLNKKA